MPKEQLSPEQAIRKCTGDYFGHPVPDSVDDWSPAPAIHTWGDFRDLVATHRADAASQSLRERDEARADNEKLQHKINILEAQREGFMNGCARAAKAEIEQHASKVSELENQVACLNETVGEILELPNDEALELYTAKVKAPLEERIKGLEGALERILQDCKPFCQRLDEDKIAVGIEPEVCWLGPSPFEIARAALSPKDTSEIKEEGAE